MLTDKAGLCCFCFLWRRGLLHIQYRWWMPALHRKSTSLKISVLPQESLSQLSPSFEWKHSFIRDPDMKDSSNHVSVSAEGSDGSLVHIRWLGFICLLWVMLFQVRVLHWISSIYAARVGLTVLDSEWWDSLDCLVMIVLSTGRLLS